MKKLILQSYIPGCQESVKRAIIACSTILNLGGLPRGDFNIYCYDSSKLYHPEHRRIISQK